MLMIVCILFLAATGARLWYVQTTYAEKFEELDCFENVRSGPIPASRGRILDNEGLPLADNRIVYTLFVNPNLVDDEIRGALAGNLIEHFGIDVETTRNALMDAEATYRPLILEMSRDEVALFEELAKTPTLGEIFREVGIQEREARVYPQGGIAGPVIGFTGKRTDGQVGLWGIENLYNDILNGRSGWYEDRRDQRGMRIPGTRVEIAPSRNGSDLHLTLNASIQRLAEEALERGVTATGALGGTVVITEPSSGKVLALATAPTFDPSSYIESLEEENSLFSSSTCLSYESGSVMKVFTFAAALEEGLITTGTTWDVGFWPIIIGGKEVPDHVYEEAVHTLEYAIVHSSNRAAALTAIEFDPEVLTGWLRNFGFGRKTPLCMPGEPSGNLKEWLRPLPTIDLANMGFGHGIAVTPLQIAQGIGIFANDGVLVPISLVEKRYDPASGITHENFHDEPVRVISSETTDIVLEYMVGVIEEGTAIPAQTEWTCAAKTGTAQKVDPDGNYYKDKMYATIAGFGPVPDPRYLIVVILDEPGEPYFGGTAAGPVFREIFNGLMLRDGGLISRVDEPGGNPDGTDTDSERENTDSGNREDEYVISRNPFAEEHAWDVEFGG